MGGVGSVVVEDVWGVWGEVFFPMVGSVGDSFWCDGWMFVLMISTVMSSLGLSSEYSVYLLQSGHVLYVLPIHLSPTNAYHTYPIRIQPLLVHDRNPVQPSPNPFATLTLCIPPPSRGHLHRHRPIILPDPCVSLSQNSLCPVKRDLLRPLFSFDYTLGLVYICK